MPLRTLSVVLVLLSIAPSYAEASEGKPRAQQPSLSEAGITGEVRAADGTAVTQGTVVLMMSPTSRINAPIDRHGQFRILPDGPGWQRLFISVPGHAPYRAAVTVPPSRTLKLPAITLLEPTYFHARFVTKEGEPLAAAGIRRQAMDIDGAAIVDPLDHVREQAEPDGSITIGPLWPGRTMMVFSRPQLAQTRLRDVNTTGKKQVIEGGTIAIGQGAQLHVDILDGRQQPVPRHEVWLEDTVQPSPLFFPAVKTNEEGRAVFEHLGAGRYRVWTRSIERCGNNLTLSRVVSTGDSGVAHARMVVDGRAVLRITSPLGPVAGRAVFLSPESPSQPPWLLRMAAFRRRAPIVPSTPPGCRGVTDQDGRVVISPMPPGPAELRVTLFNSTYIMRLAIPEGGREVTIAVPDGLIPVKVTDRTTQQPLQALVTWVGGGARVEATTTGNGDALLEAPGAIGGTLTVNAREHQTLEGSFDQTPETLQEVSLVPMPSERVTVRVVSSSGEAVAAAVVQLLGRGASDADEFMVADAKGAASFTEVPPGPLQFSAHADGFTSATVRIAEDERAAIVITLARTP